MTSQIKSRGILTARFEYHFLGQNGPTSSAHKIFRFNPKHLKLRNRVFQTIYFSTVPKNNSCHMHFKHWPFFISFFDLFEQIFNQGKISCTDYRAASWEKYARNLKDLFRDETVLPLPPPIAQVKWVENMNPMLSGKLMKSTFSLVDCFDIIFTTWSSPGWKKKAIQNKKKRKAKISHSTKEKLVCCSFFFRVYNMHSTQFSWLASKRIECGIFNNYSPKAKWILSNNPRGEVDPEENNCFSIIAQVIIRATAFPFILLVSSLETSRNRSAAILKISTSVL